ncbi:hypothetical protein MKQ70_33630 [Chitinophaga sedimenti]|uniref:hypothetical protein n=1 Tax=Chitinophaga sedimenti TaxID=2033606 RepID=UPI00200454B7|nr:hypothetical protein [Chitinophaga sedimenti]MCK7559623.1 hypothetical protein [Chitinophaga sedimenti]
MIKKLMIGAAALLALAACKKEKDEPTGMDLVFRVGEVWVESSLKEDTIYFEGRDGKNLLVQIKYRSEIDTAYLAGWYPDRIMFKPTANGTPTTYSFKLDQQTKILHSDNFLTKYGSGKVTTEKVTFTAVNP